MIDLRDWFAGQALAGVLASPIGIPDGFTPTEGEAMSDQQRAAAGGSAFPPSEYGGGMTLRDWFAGQALAGELSAQSGIPDGWTYSQPKEYRDLAGRCYEIADAMIAARRTTTPAT